MANATNFLETTLLNSMFRTGSGYRPAGLHLALLTAVANAEAGTVTEASGSGYARTALTQSDAFWTAPADDAGSQMISNAATIACGTPTGGNWGTITHVGIYDASSGGNLLLVAAVGTAKATANGDPVEIAAGQLKISVA